MTDYTPPPIKHDHRQTWLGIGIVVGLFAGVVVVSLLVRP